MYYNEQLYFWRQQKSDVAGMMCNPEAFNFEASERTEIISYLPDLRGKRILEPAAGIGRFTTYFASVAEHVTAIDFVDKFIKKNIKASLSFLNTTHHIGNMMDVDIENESFDLVFVNWLLMYLGDDDALVLCDRIDKWLKPEGELFLRESCVSASNPNRPHSHAQYRDPEFYEDLFIQKFSLLSKGNVVIYEQRYANSNQRWWLFKKIRFN